MLFQGKGTGKGTNLFVSKSGGKLDWPIEDGSLVSTRGGTRSNHIVSRYHFGDAQIHAEFMLPTGVPKSQMSGNSGLYIHGNYELQIFNSYGKEKFGKDDCGSIYGISPPLALAVRPPGVWQKYDVVFIAPGRDQQGIITSPGSITALLNGVLVQHNAQFREPVSTYHPLRYKTTPYTDKLKDKLHATGTGPLFLQDHDSPVRFRNVWIRPLDDRAGMFKP